jgi:hypothetical protein
VFKTWECLVELVSVGKHRDLDVAAVFEIMKACKRMNTRKSEIRRHYNLKEEILLGLLDP